MAARERRYERERGLTLLPRNKQGIWKLHEERMDGTAGAEFVAMEEEGQSRHCRHTRRAHVVPCFIS